MRNPPQAEEANNKTLQALMREPVRAEPIGPKNNSVVKLHA